MGWVYACLATRLPRIYLPFVVLTVCQPLLFIVAGVTHGPDRGLWLMILLLFGLAWGSRVAWGLLVVLNLFPLLAVGLAAGSSGHTLWGNVALLLLTGLALEAMLLAPAMRHHVGVGRPRPASGTPALP